MRTLAGIVLFIVGLSGAIPASAASKQQRLKDWVGAGGPCNGRHGFGLGYCTEMGTWVVSKGGSLYGYLVDHRTFVKPDAAGASYDGAEPDAAAAEQFDQEIPR